MLLLTIITATSYAAVEKRYVGDKIWLQLRSGPGSDFRILKALPSGEHLIFREQTEDKNYTKVTTDKGVEGWVLSRFLEDEPVAKEKLILSQRELVKVKAELNTLKQQTNTLSEEKSSLSGDRSSLTRENKTLEKELKRIKEISANALQLDSKNTKLTKRNQELEIQLETFTAENTRLKDNKERTFMIIGGGLIIFGIFLGLAIPAMRGGRKAASWS
ncbi:MAG: SH3 domain protein [Oleispira sp.]|jgi:SH3 domain protein